MTNTMLIKKEAIGSWNNVAAAMYRAASGKTCNLQVREALGASEKTINNVSAALRAGHLPVGKFNEFVIYDPKQRIIHAAPFVDRIAHHAIVSRLEPVFERVLLPTVFACRPNKGVHKAISYAQKQFRRFHWVMHVDIKHYFPNIDHAILKQQLRRRFRGDGLTLLDAVIDSYTAANDHKGLPIGALTSQHFANHYLAEADRWCLAHKGVAAHCRYMDDFLLWGQSKQNLKDVRDDFIKYLESKLRLSIKDPLIQRTHRGLLFCGIHIKPFQLKASKRRRRRYMQARQHWEQRYKQGEINSQQLQRAYSAVLAILLPASSLAFRKEDLQKRGSVNA